MKKTLIALMLATCGLAMAQTAPTDSELYKTFGEKPGLVKLMDDFMVRLLADPRTGPHFKPSNQQRVKEQLVDQFCQVMGGPCACTRAPT
jgi:hemoglobin